MAPTLVDILPGPQICLQGDNRGEWVALTDKSQQDALDFYRQESDSIRTDSVLTQCYLNLKTKGTCKLVQKTVHLTLKGGKSLDGKLIILPVINLRYNKRRYQPLALYFWTGATPMKAEDYRIFVEDRFKQWDEMFAGGEAFPDDVKHPSENLRAIRLRDKTDGDEVTAGADHGGMVWQNARDWFMFEKWGFVHNFGMFLQKRHLNLKRPWWYMRYMRSMMKLYGGQNNRQTGSQALRRTLADHLRTLQGVNNELHRRV